MLSLTRQAYSVLFVLSILCGLGYYFALPFLQGLDFVFGSIATLLIIHLFGVRWAVLITLIASSYTVILWGHAYGVIVFTLEALFIGLVWQRHNNNLLLLQGIFWLCIAIPTVLLLSSLQLKILYLGADYIPTEENSTFDSLFLLKMMINSIFNSAIANLMILHLPLKKWVSGCSNNFKPSLRQIITNIIIAFALLVSLIDIVVNTQRVVGEIEVKFEQDMNDFTHNIAQHIKHVNQQQLKFLNYLKYAAIHHQLQMSTALQDNVKLGLTLLPDIIQIRLYNSQSALVFQQQQADLEDKFAHLDDQNKADLTTIIKDSNYSYDISYLEIDNIPQAIITHHYPLKDKQKLLGFLSVDIKIKNAQHLKQTNLLSDDTNIFLLNQHYQILSSSHDALAFLSLYQRLPNTAFTKTEGYHIWKPENSVLSDVVYWQHKIHIKYYNLALKNQNLPFILVVEVPFSHYTTILQRFYNYKLATISILLLVSLILAMLISHWLVRPITHLRHITYDLAGRIESHYQIVWPHSQVAEIDALTRNFKAMASSLQARFTELQQARALLTKDIAERTAELAGERVLLRNLIDSIPDLIFYKDCDGQYLGGNQAFERFSERPLAQLIGKNDEDLFPKRQAMLYQQRDQQVLASKMPILIEESFQHPQSSQQILMEVLITPFFDENHQLLGLIGICRDITARRQAEQALQHSQAMLRLVMDTIPQYIFWQDLAGRYIGCNRNYAHIIGLNNAEQIVGKNDDDLAQIQPIDTVFFTTLQTFINANQQPIYQQTQALKLNNGIQIWLEISKVPLCNEQNQPLGMLVSFADITERKRVDEKLRQTVKVLENSAEAICITDAHIKITSINKAFTQITGYDEAEVLGKRPTMLRSGKHTSSFYKHMWRSILQTGHWEGEIWNRRKNGEIYPEWLHITIIKDEEDNITNYLAIFSDITIHKQTEERLAYLAHYDDLTGLPNRTLFYERFNRAIHHAQRENSKVALIFMDLDRFKYVNDTWGHAIGDQLLKEVANRLTTCTRKSDTIARLGGDEFIAVLENIDISKEAAHIADKMLAAMQPPFHLNGYETFMTTSMGISVYPDDGENVDTLLKNADAAMYRAKEGGKNNYQFFTTQMNVQAHQRLVMETQLRHALERDEFLLYYQPQMHIVSGKIVGVEVLLRWQHPERGLVSPYEFIPLAEETGFIVPLGEWVLKKACHQHRLWRISGYPILRMSVNVSSRQFREQSFIERLVDVLDVTEMDPNLLELELTESILIQDATMATQLLQILKRMGIQLAIDDFGTGYSSLSYLKRFPIDKLKIDQAFIRDIPNNPEDMMITRAIIALAQSLRLQVIAEGVENRQQLAFLKSLKCDEVQGYLVGHPLPATDFLRLLD